MPQRLPRGNGRAKFSAADDAEDEPDLEVLDEETGNPIVEDAPITIEDEPADEPKPESAGDDAFEILKRGKAEADAALAAERRKSADLERRAATSETDLDSTNAALLKNAAAQARAQVQAAQNAYAAAMANSDFAAAGAAQAAIAERIAEAREFEAAIGEFEREIAERRAAPVVAKKADAPADPTEAIIAQMTPASATWLRANKDKTMSSPAKWSRTIAAHHAAVEAGHEVDSPEYFQFLETDMNIKAAPVTTNSKPTAKRAPPMAAAPVTRGATTGTAGSVTLSKAEREAAGRLRMSVTKYAKLKHQASEAAKDPDYSGPRYSRDNPAIAKGR